MILLGAATQGMASIYWYRGLHAASAGPRAESIARSLQWWPWASHRQIALSRANVDLISHEPRARQFALAKVLRQEWNRTLLWDPYDWELRLECVWLDLAFSGNSQRALAEARDVVKLNPLQPQIPLRLAQHYANYDPETAWEFLLSGFPYPEKHFYEALAMAWQVRGETAALWRMTPNRVESLLILRDFAASQKLFAMAGQAYERATNLVDSLPARSGPR